MNLDELQSIRDRERQTSDLQQLRESFYQDVGDYVERLREERSTAAEQADDPFSSPEVRRLSNDIESAEQTVEAIYERRVGKLVKMASFAAADMPVEDGGLTAEERALFERLVEAIEANRDHVLDVLAGDAEGGAPIESGSTETTPDPAGEGDTPDPAGEPEPADRGVDAASLMGDSPAEAAPEEASEEESEAPPVPPAEAAPPSEEATPPVSGAEDREAPEQTASDGGTAVEEAPSTDRRTVRITADVGEIFGVDEREYDLSRDDVVDLPEANAAPLVERDAAELLE